MSCNCNKPKCDGKCGISPSVLQINNPGDCTLFHRVEVPASMGDSKTNPPKNGDYRNVLLYYVADGTSWLFSSDGIPQKLVNGFTNYEDAVNLPIINNVTLIGSKTGAELGLQDKLIAGDNIQIAADGKTISATDTTYTAGRGLTLDANNEFSANIATESDPGIIKPGDGLSVEADGALNVDDPAPEDFFDGLASDSDCGSNITLDNMIGGRPESFELKGDTVQSGTPTPSAPAAIQTVTGIQTIAINGTNYTVNLGSTELCKIGVYQDKIYNDGSIWKIYKAIEKVSLTGSSGNWVDRSNTSPTYYKVRSNNGTTLPSAIATNTSIICTHFPTNSGANSQTYSGNAICGVASAGNDRNLWFSIDNTIVSTAAQFATWLTNNNPTVYYAQATPTTTIVTDADLIAQLNSIQLASGSNTITITSSGLAGELCIGSYEDNWAGNIARIDSRLDSIPTQHVPVEQFGVYGDGVHDDTDALQNAITACVGKTLLLGPKTYSITKPLSASDITIEGNDASIVAASGFSGSAMIIPHNAVSISEVKFDANDSVDSCIGESADSAYLGIEDCDFTGAQRHVNESNFALNSAVYVSALEADITGSNIHDNMSHGLRLKAHSAHATANIDNCKFINNGSRAVGTEVTALGLAQYGGENGSFYDKVSITNCYATDNANTGIAPHCCNNVIISGCVCSRNGEHGICLMDGKNGVISDCVCENNYRYGIRIQGDYTTTGAYHGYKNCIITGCYIKGSGFDIDEDIDTIKVSNNLCVYSETGTSESIKGLRLGRGDKQSSYVKNGVFTGNQFNGYQAFPIQSFNYIDSSCVFDNYVDGERTTLRHEGSNYVRFNTGSTLKYGDTNNVLASASTDFSQWSTASGATISNNVITRGTNDFVAYYRTVIQSKPRFVSLIANFSDYSDGAIISFGIRFRDSNDTLCSGDYYQNVEVKGNYLGEVFDLAKVNNLSYNDIDKIEVFIRLSSESIKMSYLYCALSDELPILPNVIA